MFVHLGLAGLDGLEQADQVVDSWFRCHLYVSSVQPGRVQGVAGLFFFFFFFGLFVSSSSLCSLSLLSLAVYNIGSYRQLASPLAEYYFNVRLPLCPRYEARK